MVFAGSPAIFDNPNVGIKNGQRFLSLMSFFACQFMPVSKRWRMMQ